MIPPRVDVLGEIQDALVELEHTIRLLAATSDSKRLAQASLKLVEVVTLIYDEREYTELGTA